MNAPAGQKSGENPPPVSLRQEQPGDEGFLFDVFASTRTDELARTNWDESLRRTFLNQQFNAMRQGYRSMFSSGDFLIIELEGRPVGRMVVSRSAAEIRVVDLALLPDQRNRGVGTFLMGQVCAEAADAGRPVRLCVLKNNHALQWYERLGFKKIGEQGFYDELEWRPTSARAQARVVSPAG